MRYLLIGFIALGFTAKAQNASVYLDSMQAFRDRYIQTHEVVKKDDRAYMQFFAIDTNFHLKAKFERINEAHWFSMKTSGRDSQTYRKYGKISFILNGKNYTLTIYQSQSLMSSKEYKDYLFIPFTDSTSGEESYGGGRYLECFIGDIHDQILELDFNKAYNPYCAYATGYNCPIPPKENDLAVAIRAGEKNYGKKAH